MSTKNEMDPLFHGASIPDVGTKKKQFGLIGALFALLAMSSFLAGQHSASHATKAAAGVRDLACFVDISEWDEISETCGMGAALCLSYCGFEIGPYCAVRCMDDPSLTGDCIDLIGK